MVIADLDFVGDEEKWLGILKELNHIESASNQVAIQIRVKGTLKEHFLKLAAAARDAITNSNLVLVLNGCAQDAVRLDYDACHQPEDQLTEIDETTLLMHSAAAHSLESVQRASLVGVDLIVLSPIFEPTWKSGQALGVERLQSIVESAEVPILALGGINRERVPEIKESGVAGIAVLSTVLQHSMPAKFTSELLQTWLTA